MIKIDFEVKCKMIYSVIHLCKNGLNNIWDLKSIVETKISNSIFKIESNLDTKSMLVENIQTPHNSKLNQTHTKLFFNIFL